MTLLEVWTLLNQGGVPALLLLAIWGAMTGKYVFRREYDEVVRQRDKNQEIIDKLTDAAVETIHLVKKAERGG